MPNYVQDLPVNIMTKTSKRLRGSNAQIVKDIDDKNRKWVAAHRDDQDRMFAALGAFFDINGGSWPKRERDALIAQGRHPVSFNVAEQKLQSLAGSIYSEKWDFDFLPMNLDENSLTKGIKYWYYADKEQFNYSHSERKCLERGLIHAGYEEMSIDYSIRSTGGIAFKSCLPGTVVPDPYWVTDDYKDWRDAIQHAWMTPRQIMEYYETSDPQIVLAAKAIDLSGHKYETTDDLEKFRDREYGMPQWGDKYLVIQNRWLEKLKTTRLHAKMPDGEWFALPVGVEEEAVRAFVSMNGLSWEDIKEFPYEDNILYLASVVPQLSQSAVLFKGKHDIQCGTIGLFPFTSVREMGMNKGIMEKMLDIQRTLNYRESKKDDIIASTASGAVAANLDALPNGERDLANLKANKTRPDFVQGVHGNPRDVLAAIPRGDVPPDIWNDIAQLVDMFDRVSPVTPALEGAAQKGESGVLFEMRHAVTKLGTVILYDNWQQHLMNKAEAWYNQAQITYKGQYKQVKTDEGQDIEFNSPVYDDMGQKYYENSTDDLPRARVIIALSKSSPTERISEQMKLYDMTKILAANPELFKDEIRVLTSRMFNTMEWSPEDMQKLKMFDQMKTMRDMIGIMTEIKNLQASGMNAEVMMGQAQQMIQQMQAQMQPQQGGGAPQALSPAQGGGAAEPTQLPPPPEGTEPGAPIETFRGEFRP